MNSSRLMANGLILFLVVVLATNTLFVVDQRQQAIVVRFGRFPHRNAILGRSSSAEELAFLNEPGSSF